MKRKDRWLIALVTKYHYSCSFSAWSDALRSYLKQCLQMSFAVAISESNSKKLQEDTDELESAPWSEPVRSSLNAVPYKPLSRFLVSKTCS